MLSDATATNENNFNGALASVKVGLFSTNFALDGDTLLTDLGESSFGGYARSAVVTWGDVHFSSETQTYYISGQKVTFSCTSNTAQQQVYGWFLATNEGYPILVCSEKFTSSELPDTGDVIEVVPRFALNSASLSPSGARTAT